MANRSDRGLGQPDECLGRNSPHSRMGPNPRKPSRPAVTITASTGRTQDCTRPPRQHFKSFLATRVSGTKQSAQQNGTQSAETIKASGHNHRINRPDTRLHPTTTPPLQIIHRNADAIHTRHSNRQVRFRIIYVCFWGISGRMAGLSVESVVDPYQSFWQPRFS